MKYMMTKDKKGLLIINSVISKHKPDIFSQS